MRRLPLARRYYPGPRSSLLSECQLSCEDERSYLSDRAQSEFPASENAGDMGKEDTDGGLGDMSRESMNPADLAGLGERGTEGPVSVEREGRDDG